MFFARYFRDKKFIPLIIILSIIFLLQGTGVAFGGVSAYLLVCIAVCLSFIVTKIPYDPYHFPKTITILLVLFLLFSIISTIFSMNIQRSVYVLFQYVVASMVLIYGYNNKDILRKLLAPLLLGIGLVLCIYSLLLNNFQVLPFFPQDGYQLVFSRFGSHNHLGDFLILPLLICIYSLFYRKKKLVYLLLFLFLLPFFFFSYSRSAYLSFSLVLLYFLVKNIHGQKKRFKLTIPIGFFSVIMCISFLFIFVTVFEARRFPVVQAGHTFLVDKTGLGYKSFDASRVDFARSALFSIKEKPLFGVGPNNFIYASKKYSVRPNFGTETSHNIFLDIFSENGIFAFVCFFGIVFLVLKCALNDKSVYTLLFLALLLNFLTDYTFRISSMSLLFFLLMGLLYSKSDRLKEEL